MDQNNIKTPKEYSTHGQVHNGPVLGILVIILVIILSGLYLWGSTLNTQKEYAEMPLINNEPETPRAKTDVEILQVLSPSDEMSAIEADIVNTNLDMIDADIQTIDAETSPLFVD